MPRTPNREEDLARPRSRRGGTVRTVAKGTARPVTIPDPDPGWGKCALMIWEGALSSGQADYYQQSDIALLYSLCDDVSRYKNPAYIKDDGTEVHKANGQVLHTIYSTLGRLLIAEADRRAAYIELLAPDDPAPSASVAVMESYRRGLAVVPDQH